MSRQWLTLMAILLVYIPVAIDATVLHVAAPTLSVRWGPAAMSCCGSLIFIH
jgi:DHA2 family multidrug resistance protein-like MFS transporter